MVVTVGRGSLVQMGKQAMASHVEHVNSLCKQLASVTANF